MAAPIVLAALFGGDRSKCSPFVVIVFMTKSVGFDSMVFIPGSAYTCVCL